MSLSPAPTGVLLLLQQHGHLAGVNSACDFGSMEFDARAKENNKPYERFFEGQGKPVPPSLYDAETGRLYGIAGDMYRALGWDYASFDIDGRWGSYPIDLNTETLPAEYQQRFGLTMNIGTSEHVFNQYNFFLQFHNVTRVGGLMFHVVPFNNYANHGLYQYCPTFFLSLARYNKYEMVGFWQTSKPNFYWFRNAQAKPEGARVTLVCVMRRTSADEFRFPLQINEPMLINSAAAARYGTFERDFMEDLRSGATLPSEFHLNVEEATVTPGLPAVTAEAGPTDEQVAARRAEKAIRRKEKEARKAATYAERAAAALEQGKPPDQ
ncbi:MAG: hypothetical protein AB7I25_13095 [Vicinamibacterales bacterium]